LKHLAGLVLTIVHELVGVLRLIELAHLREDAELAEHALHAEGPRLVRDDRHGESSDRLVAQERVEDAYERHRGGDFALFGAGELRAEGGKLRDLGGWGLAPSLGQAPAELTATLLQVFLLRAAFCQLQEGDFFEL